MPIYEYKCADCGHKKEVLQKLSDAPLKECPACGKLTMVKLISAAGFQLKGSGWYATDFKGGSKPAKSGEEKSEGGSKNDSKPSGEAKTGGADKSEGSGKAQVESKPKKEETKADAPASSTVAGNAGQ